MSMKMSSSLNQLWTTIPTIFQWMKKNSKTKTSKVFFSIICHYSSYTYTTAEQQETPIKKRRQTLMILLRCRNFWFLESFQDLILWSVSFMVKTASITIIRICRITNEIQRISMQIRTRSYTQKHQFFLDPQLLKKDLVELSPQRHYKWSSTKYK